MRIAVVIFLILGITNNLYSQCSVDPFIEDNYELGAKFLALREILSDPSDPDYDNPFLPQARVTPFLEKLSAIYENPNNNPSIDSLFNEFQFKVNQEYNYPVVYKMMIFSVDTNIPWVQAFKDTGISGEPIIDNLMATYQFSIDSFIDLQSCGCTHFRIITSFDFLNVHALIDDFEEQTDLNSVETYFPNFIEARLNYEGIPYFLNSYQVSTCDIIVEEDRYTFCLYAGDCPAGCLYAKCWVVEVSEDCSIVTVLSSSEFITEKFSIYPNPSDDTIHIHGVTSEVNSLLIYSVTGNLVYSAVSNSETIDISNLNAGLYFLEVTTSEGQKQTQKFIKK